MNDESILKLIGSTLEDRILAINILAGLSREKILEFFKKYNSDDAFRPDNTDYCIEGEYCDLGVYGAVYFKKEDLYMGMVYQHVFLDLESTAQMLIKNNGWKIIEEFE